jgi:hypothetical protein
MYPYHLLLHDPVPITKPDNKQEMSTTVNTQNETLKTKIPVILLGKNLT